MIIIEKYQNGKLYNVTGSVYTTLEEIEELVPQEPDLQIIDNRDGVDITAQVMLDVIHAKQQKSGTLSIARLRGIIKNGTLGQYFEWLDSQR